MKTKLTKEQSEWLIERFGKTYWAQTQEGLLDQKTIRQIVKECTEKEFPTLKAITGHDEVVSVRLADYSLPGKVIRIETETNISEFDYDYFKEFAEGVNKIVEWIEEQE